MFRIVFCLSCFQPGVTVMGIRAADPAAVLPLAAGDTGHGALAAASSWSSRPRTALCLAWPCRAEVTSVGPSGGALCAYDPVSLELTDLF